MSTRKIINPASLTRPRAPLSHGVKVGNHQVFKNIIAVLQEAGTTLDKVIKANIILADSAPPGARRP